ncbi:MAG: ABC transporter substrate-binding protein [Rhodomicrobium sp.]|nr:ABC transporter substrate-binding protein [Rhodomicrobium sp.]
MRFGTLFVAAAALLASMTASQAETAVKIGILNDRSGLYADLAGEGSVIAAKMAIEDFKAAEKGLKVEVVAADHQNKPDIGVNKAREWYDQDGVDAIFDVPNSGVALAISELKGGKVLGSVKHPLNTQDFSSFLLQAQSSGAKVIGLANAGGDTINAIKQASEFGIVQAGQKLAGLLVFITDVHSLGLKAAQGLVLTSPFYWDLNDGTRAWSDRFLKATTRRPSMVQAGVYSGVLHYLKAVSAVGSAKDALKVVAKMKEMPTDDPLFGKGTVRADGRVLHDSYLFEVKKPEESKGPWDYYKLISTTPADKAFRPMSEGGCPLVAGK